MKATRWFHPEAESELDAAAIYYENEREGYGARFAAEIDRTLRVVEASPRVGTLWQGGPVRVLRTKRFPFLVVYLERMDGVAVVAIAHTKRRPGYWSDRL